MKTVEINLGGGHLEVKKISMMINPWVIQSAMQMAVNFLVKMEMKLLWRRVVMEKKALMMGMQVGM